MSWPSVTLGAGASSSGTTGGGSISYSHTISAGQTLLSVLVGQGRVGGADSVTGITWNGVALTQKGTKTDSTWTTSQIWELTSSLTATTANVVVSFNSGVDSLQIASNSISFDDASTTTGTVSNGTTNNTTDPTLTVVDSANTDIVISMWATDDQSTTTTSVGTSIMDVENLGADSDHNAQYQTATGASTVCSWTHTSGGGGTGSLIGVAVRAATQFLNATPGGWTWAGSSSPITRGPETAFQQDAFQSNAFQIFGGTVGGGGVTTINAGVGAWNWAGSQATTTQLINAGVGAWNWAGSTASTTQLINAGVGAWTWAGTTATTTQLINAGVGAWTWAGISVSFAGATEVNATPGAWNWAGTTATTTQLINASVGAWNWAGAQASTTQLINAGIGAFSWAGSQASFSQLINASVGAWNWAGTQSEIVQFITINAGVGLWDWTGTRASFGFDAVADTGAGSSRRRRERYIARFKGEDYYFGTLEGLEEFVKWALESEKPKPKKVRKPVKIRLTPAFAEEVSQYVEIPARISQLPVSKALEQVRKLESRVSEDEDDDWLILTA